MQLLDVAPNCVVGHVNRTFHRLSVSPLTRCYSIAATQAKSSGKNIRDLYHTFDEGHIWDWGVLPFIERFSSIWRLKCKSVIDL